MARTRFPSYQFSTEDLLSLVKTPDTDRDISYRATEETLRRWRRSQDLNVLIGLANSPSTTDVGFAAYFICELGMEVPPLLPSVSCLSDHPLRSARHAFARYAFDAGKMDGGVRQKMAKLLADTDLYVRQEVMCWALGLPEPVFHSFVEEVERHLAQSRDQLSRAGLVEACGARSCRAIEIVRALRAGDGQASLEGCSQGEDALVLHLVSRRWR